MVRLDAALDREICGVRARNIKPSLFKNEVLGVADPLLTILFEGLWCEADRDGRLEDRPLRLKAEIFPYRNDTDIEAMLNWLNEREFIRRYEVRGIKVIQVSKFSDHQRPHNNEVESVLPSMEASKHNQGKKSAQPRKKALRSDPLLSDSGSLIPDTGSLEGRAPEKSRAARSTAAHLPADFELTPERRAIAIGENLDPERTFAKFKNHFESASGANARKRNWDAAWRKWCMTEYDRGRPNGSGAHKPAVKIKSIEELEAEEEARVQH